MSCHAAEDTVQLTSSNKPTLQPQQCSSIYITYIAVAQLVEALRYKPQGRGFDSRWCHIFSLT
jgi:hypothetical protein